MNINYYLIIAGDLNNTLRFTIPFIDIYCSKMSVIDYNLETIIYKLYLNFKQFGYEF